MIDYSKDLDDAIKMALEHEDKPYDKAHIESNIPVIKEHIESIFKQLADDGYDSQYTSIGYDSYPQQDGTGGKDNGKITHIMEFTVWCNQTLEDLSQSDLNALNTQDPSQVLDYLESKGQFMKEIKLPIDENDKAPQGGIYNYGNVNYDFKSITIETNIYF